MMRVLLALVFATGVGLIWFGAVVGVQLQPSTVPLTGVRRLLEGAGLDLSPYVFVAAMVGCGAVAGLLGWLVIGLVAVGIGALAAGVFAPVAWARSRRERHRREREQAWPAVLAQLADALEAGLAWPAAVALAGRSGPEALRGEWTAFAARLHGTDLDTALEGLRGAGERTADSVALLLRAALVELPTGGLAQVLRELSTVLSERLESREKARSQASRLHTEAAVLALSPAALLLLIGAVSPSYLAAYRGVGGTIVLLIGGGLILGCYLLMLRLGRVPEPRRTEGARS